MSDSPKINPRAFTYYRRLGKVRDYVERHLSDDLTLKTVAQVVGLNEKYFSVFFYERTGVYFREWVNSIRVRRAMELMKARNYAISDVAFEVGYKDLRTFERAFKRQTAMTPREYRRSVQPDLRRDRQKRKARES